MAAKSLILAKDSDNRLKDKHQLTGIVRRIFSGLMRKFSECRAESPKQACRHDGHTDLHLALQRRGPIVSGEAVQERE